MLIKPIYSMIMHYFGSCYPEWYVGPGNCVIHGRVGDGTPKGLKVGIINLFTPY